MAGRLAIMTEGQIVQCGTPQEVYAFPSTRFVAGFIGSANIFEGTIVVDEADHVQLEAPALERPVYVDHGVSEPLGMEVYLSVRPENIRVSRQQPTAGHNWAHGVVSHAAWMGSYVRYQVRLDSGFVFEATMPGALMAATDAPAIDDEVYLSWSSDSVTVLAS